jgi:Domain of unknown function (DUF4279)
MSPCRYRFSLRLRHPRMDPREISRALGSKPQFQWMAGEKRATPKGQPLDGVNASTYWCSEGIEREGLSLTEALSSHLSTLEDRRAFLREFVSTGGAIEYFVTWLTNGVNTGAIFDWQLLRRLSALQVDLDLDVYGDNSGGSAPNTRMPTANSFSRSGS